MVWERGEDSISTCGCKDADARLDECCLWDGGAAMFRRTSEKKTRYQGGQKGGCQKSRGVDREGRCRFARMPAIAHRRGGCAPECTSLLCTFGIVRTPCPVTKGRSPSAESKMEADRDAHIFPSEYGAALTAIDVPHGVVACSHLTVVRFAFDNVDPAHIHPISTSTT